MTIHPTAYEVIFPFGKHKGMSYGFIAETDPGYLNWLIKTETMPKPIRDNASKTIAGLALNAPTTDGKSEVGTMPIIRMWGVKKEMVAVSFEYNPELVERFKHAIDGRVWNKAEGHWEFPEVHLPRAIEFFGGTKNVLADDKVKNAYKKELDRRKKLDEIRNKETTDLEIGTWTVVGEILNWKETATLLSKYVNKK